MKKSIIHLFIILSYLSLTGTVHAQSKNNSQDSHTLNTGKKMEDVVYLKNGAIVRGIIIEQVPNKTLEIKSNDNNYFIFNMDEVRKIAKENIVTELSDYKKKGYVVITELGFGFGINTIDTYKGSFKIEGQAPIIGLRVINGYQLNEYFSFGLGAGFEAFLDGDNKGALIPLSIDSRINFIKNKFTPTFNLNVGYAIGVQNSSGLTANPSVGIKLYLTKKIGLLFNLGYKVQQQNIKRPDQYGVEIPRIVNYQFLSMSTGLFF